MVDDRDLVDVDTGDGRRNLLDDLGKDVEQENVLSVWSGGLVHLGHTIQHVDLRLAVGDDRCRFAFCPQLGSLHFGLGWGDHVGFEPALLQLDSYGFELLFSGDLGLLTGDHCFVLRDQTCSIELGLAHPQLVLLFGDDQVSVDSGQLGAAAPRSLGFLGIGGLTGF